MRYAERERQIGAPAVTEFEPRFNTLVDIYTHSIDRFADRPLFRTKTDGAWHWLTYREFGDRAQLALSGLADLGVGKGDRVAIISDNRVEWAVAAYAAYGLGAAVVPMYENQLDKDWKYILSDCDARVLFAADAEIADRVAAFRDDLGALEHVVVFDGEAAGAVSFSKLLDQDPAPTGPTQVDPMDIAGTRRCSPVRVGGGVSTGPPALSTSELAACWMWWRAGTVPDRRPGWRNGAR